MQFYVVLKSQDLLLAMKLAATPGVRWKYADLGASIGVSTSEARYAMERAALSGLVSERTRQAIRPALLEFLVHGARYSFPAELGRRVRGMPTGSSAPPLSEQVVAEPPESTLVWKYAEGDARGQSVSPIYASAAHAAAQDEKLYRLLALLDGIRVGPARVRALATELLRKDLG